MTKFVGTIGNDRFQGDGGNNSFTTGNGGDDEFTGGNNSADTYIVDTDPSGLAFIGTVLISDQGDPADILDLTGLIGPGGQVSARADGRDLVLTNGPDGGFIGTIRLVGQLTGGSTDGVETIRFGGNTISIGNLVDAGFIRDDINDLIRQTDRPPVLAVANPTANAVEDQSTAIDLDSFVRDPDGDAITYRITGFPFNADGSIDRSNLIVTPKGNNLDPSKFTIEATARGETLRFDVNVTKTAVNDAPLAVNDSAALVIGQDSVVINALANDSDEEGERLTISQVLDAPNVDILSNGTLQYNRLASVTSPDTFSYEVQDASGAKSTAVVSVTIQSDPNAPLAVGDNVVGTARQLQNGLKIAVLKNDTSVLGKKGLDLNSLTIIDQPDHGTLRTAKGKAIFTADSSFDGTDSFSYTIADKAGRVSDIATVVIQGPDII